MSDLTHESFNCVLPWRTGNQFQLLIDGDVFFPRILQSIDNALSAIDIEMYLFESGTIADQFIEALCRAKDRGVYVRLLLDHIGSHNLSHNDREKLRLKKIDLRFFNRVRRYKRFHNFSRDHRKIILIDCAIAFVGGCGISDTFSEKAYGANAWRETMVVIKGAMVHDLQLLFERSWQYYDAIHREEWRERLRKAFDKPMPKRSNQAAQSRVIASRGIGNKPIIASLINEIRKANDRVWLCTAYFYPSRKLLKSLINAANNNADVRLLLPGPHTDHPGVRYAGRSWYKKLLESGVKVYEYQPRFLHIKVALVDDWVSIGSCNFDRWNLRWNLEANIEVTDLSFIDAIESMLENDFKNSNEFQLDRWDTRSLLEKLKERFWKMIGVFLARIDND